MTTYGDFFTGFGGMTIGAKAAGLEVLFGVEYDPDLAAVYRANLGDHIIVADVTDLEVATLPRVDVFHASPPCKRASVANANAEESPLDLAMAQATCRYIAQHLPDVVTIENVYQYRNFESWRVIVRALLENGYTYNLWYVNMADYGVPQTRKRMIVIARRDGGAIELPEKTHAENPTPGLFSTKARWVSWYEAIEDLIPTLPDSQFAPWQLARLPEEMRTMLFSGGGNTNFSEARPGRGCIYADNPSPTITAISDNGGAFPRALLVHGTNANGITINQVTDPAAVVVASLHSKAVMPKAFIVDGKLSKSGDERALQVHAEDEPVGTVVAAHSAMRDGRAHVAGRVVKMTPRALARFQSFPDWYALPESDRLAAKGIGNAVPPLFAEQLYMENSQ